jgi:hypothetical protein
MWLLLLGQLVAQTAAACMACKAELLPARLCTLKCFLLDRSLQHKCCLLLTARVLAVQRLRSESVEHDTEQMRRLMDNNKVGERS